MGHEDGAQPIALSGDGTPVLTALHDIAKTRSIQSGACIQTFTGHEEYAQSIAFSGDSTFESMAFSGDGAPVLTASHDRIAKTRSIESGANIQTFTGHEDCTQSVALSGNGAPVLAALRHIAKTKSIQSGVCIQTFT